MAAAQLAAAWGAAWVEIDVRTSRDGVMYLMHDKTVDRTTDGTGIFSELTSDQIDRLDAGSWYAKEFAGEPVPRFESVMRWAKQHNVKVYVDIKDVDAKAFIAALKSRDMNDQVMFWCGNGALMDRICDLAPDIPHKRSLKTVESLRKANERWRVDVIEVTPSQITDELMEEARRLDVKVMAHLLGKPESEFVLAVDKQVDMANLGELRRFVKIEREVMLDSIAEESGTADDIVHNDDLIFDADGALRVRGSFGHSHNDYYRSKPLQEALHAGMLSIEADVYVQNDELLVGHDRHELRPERTLRRLYLEPLNRAFQSLGGIDESHPNGGRVRESGRPVMLLVDFKNDGQKSWRILEKQLAEYPGLFRVVRKDADGYTIEPGPVIVTVSGQRPSIHSFASVSERRSAYDGRLNNLDSDVPAHVMPLVSTSYGDLLKYSQQNNHASLSETLQQFNTLCAKHGRLARVWATPDQQRVWKMLADNGMQLINTDSPSRLSRFLDEIAASTDGADSQLPRQTTAEVNTAQQ